MTRETSLTGLRVVLVCALALVATVVVPAMTARWWHAQRVAETRGRLHEAAEFWAVTIPSTDTVTCGAGRRPGLPEATASARGLSDQLPLHAAWLSRMTDGASESSAPAPDAWGQCVVLRVSPDGRSAFVVSAGANGLIETTLEATTPGGDDLLERIR